MKIAVFSSKNYDKLFLEKANKRHSHQLFFYEPRLAFETVSLAKGFDCVCVFVNDKLDSKVISKLAEYGVKLIAMRCAGYNNVDVETADKFGLSIVRVPAYSPYAVAEHTVGLILALNRKIHRAFTRVREGNFALEGLLGFDLNNLTAGIIGTGKIGAITANILNGFGCKLIAFDSYKNEHCQKIGVEYVSLESLFERSDIISLHCPLTPETYHIINSDSLKKMRTGVMIINTSRGGLIDTQAVIHALKSGKIGHLGLDVYEEEADLFFEDLSNAMIQDDVFARLLTFPNVIITGHQAFFTKNALENIAETTLSNIDNFKNGICSPNAVICKCVKLKNR
ncbi:MAG TPA: 2-hydroxyacid dehydrogenase [bacterium]|nr:2-hydroxyacid dehydrogenase [bacterium]